MLYFAYGTLLDPQLLEGVAPSASFQFIAHLPETRLFFPTPDGHPSVEPATGHTVWGAIFEVNGAEFQAIVDSEARHGRLIRSDLRAVDRAGHRYDVAVFAHPGVGREHSPSTEHMGRVVSGARHWNLPTGWVAGLEDLVEDALI
ncbi:MAG: gamma-glutamylcyclotransferase family protein [Actinomycetota bacterium]